MPETFCLCAAFTLPTTLRRTEECKQTGSSQQRASDEYKCGKRPQSDPAKSEAQVGVLANLVLFSDHSQRVVLSPKARC